jgi:hypothetical protein
LRLANSLRTKPDQTHTANPEAMPARDTAHVPAPAGTVPASGAEHEPEQRPGVPKGPHTSKCIAYMLLFTTGLLGSHLYYVGRYAQAFVSVHTLGFGVLGLFYDAICLGRYVDEANGERGRGKESERASERVVVVVVVWWSVKVLRWLLVYVWRACAHPALLALHVWTFICAV